jgi:signal transduction histidine kinase
MNLLPTDVGRSISDFKPNVEVHDLDALIVDVIERVQVQEREVQDSAGRWYLLRVHPYRTSDNKIDGAVIVLVDIDQIKRAEEEVRASRADLATEVAALGRLYELTSSLMVSQDLNSALGKLLEATTTILNADMGLVQLYNPECQELEIIAQQGFGDASLEHFRAAGLSAGLASSRALEQKQRVIIEDVEADAAYAPHRPIAASAGYRAVQATPILGRGGDVLAILSTFHRQPHRPSQRELDMLELYVRLAVSFIERVRAGAALKEADRRKNEFIAMLGHELRNPLGAIRNVVQIIKLSESEPGSMAEVCEILDRQTQQLETIVGDLLDMTRIIQGKIELRKQCVALSSVVTMAVESSRSFIEARRHRLTLSLPPNPTYVEVDPARLAQVLSNLLNNAAKFTESGGQIDLTAEHDVSRREVAITVRDNGVGMSPELLGRIFNMFTQGDQSPERVREGLGVGLTLVRSLVEMHGGNVEARSDGPGRGSEFIIRLPLATAVPHPEPVGPERVGRPALTRPRRILVVDDNDDQLQSLASLLRLLGHDVENAQDGPSAVTTAESFRPDLALVDIGLPGMNGYDVARRFREHPDLQKVVLVAQTGWGQEDDRRRSRDAGFDHHLVKPVDISRVQDLLAALDGEN